MTITFLDNNDSINFGNSVKKTVEGQVIRIDDISPIEHNLDIIVEALDNTSDEMPDMTLYVFGKNLLETPFLSETQTINGVTFTVNHSNGTIKAVGEASEDITLPLQTITLSAGEYTLSGCPTGGGDTKFYLSGFGTSNTGTVGTTFELTTQTTSTVELFIKASTKINKTFSPVIEVGLQKTGRKSYSDYPKISYALNRVTNFKLSTTQVIGLPDTMTLMCLSSDESIIPPSFSILAKYNQDINDSISELRSIINEGDNANKVYTDECGAANRAYIDEVVANKITASQMTTYVDEKNQELNNALNAVQLEADNNKQELQTSIEDLQLTTEKNRRYLQKQIDILTALESDTIVLTIEDATEVKDGWYISSDQKKLIESATYISYLYTIKQNSQIYFNDNFLPNYCFVGILDENDTLLQFYDKNISKGTDILPRESSPASIEQNQILVVSVVKAATDIVKVYQDLEEVESLKRHLFATQVEIANVRAEVETVTSNTNILNKTNYTEYKQGEYLTINGWGSYNVYDSYIYYIDKDSMLYFEDNFTPTICYLNILNEGEVKPTQDNFYQRKDGGTTDTLPREMSPVSVKVGQRVVVTIYVSTTPDFSLFQQYDTTVTVKEQLSDLKNSVETISRSTPKMFYSKTGDQINIYVQSSKNSNYMHYVYKKDIQSNINLNTWRFYSYEVVDENFVRLFGTPSCIEMDSVVKEPASAGDYAKDFIGGYHGSEIIDAFSVMIDGCKLDVSEENIPLTQFFNEARFNATSTMYRHSSTTENVFTRHKVNVFDRKGYFSKQQWITLAPIEVQLAYMGMMSLPVYEGDIIIANNARMDNNYVEQSHRRGQGGDLVDGSPIYNMNSNGVRQVEIYGDNLYGRATYKSDFGSSYRAFCADDQSNQYKAYFNETYGGKQLTTGDILKGELLVEFIF